MIMLLGNQAIDTDVVAYSNRVLADGGGIKNLSAVKTYIAFAKKEGWWSNLVHWSSPGLARKVSTTRITTLYCLKGADAVEVSSSGPTASDVSVGGRVQSIATYNGLSNYLLLGSGPSTDPTQLTIVTLANCTNPAIVSGCAYTHRHEANRLIQITQQAATDVRLQLRGSSAVLQAISAGASLTSTYEWLVGRTDRVADLHSMQRNGNSPVTSTYDFTTETFTANERRIGCTYNGTALANFWLGDILETIVIEAALTNTQVNALLAMLNTRYLIF